MAKKVVAKVTKASSAATLTSRLLAVLDEAPKAPNETGYEFIARLCSAVNEMSDEDFAEQDEDIKAWATKATQNMNEDLYSEVELDGVSADDGSPTEDDEGEEDAEEEPDEEETEEEEAEEEEAEEDEDEEPVKPTKPAKPGKGPPAAVVAKKEAKQAAKPVKPVKPVKPAKPAKKAAAVVDDDEEEAVAPKKAKKVAGEAKPKKSAEPRPISGSNRVRQLVCLNREASLADITKMARKEGITIDDGQIGRMWQQTKPVVDFLVSEGLLTE